MNKVFIRESGGSTVKFLWVFWKRYLKRPGGVLLGINLQTLDIGEIEEEDFFC